MTTKAPAGILAVHVSDPWDVVTELGTSVMHAVVVSDSPSEVVARLRESVSLGGTARDSVRCTVRHVGRSFDSRNGEVAANLEFFNSAEPDLQSVCAIGMVEMKAAPQASESRGPNG
jgi:hypothetical protein